MATISQAYFHFDPYHFEESSAETFSSTVEKIAEQIAAQAFEFDTSIEIVLERGSLKGWVTVSTVFTFLTAISTYSDFKSSVKEMYKDSKWFADKVKEIVIDKSDVPEADIVRTERRTKAAGQLKRLIDSIEAIETRYQEDGRLPSSEELRKLEREFERVQRSFDSKELAQIEKGLNAPGSPDRTIVLQENKFAIRPRKPYIDDVFQALLSTPSHSIQTYKMHDLDYGLTRVIDFQDEKVPQLYSTYRAIDDSVHAKTPSRIVRRTRVRGMKKFLRENRSD